MYKNKYNQILTKDFLSQKYLKEKLGPYQIAKIVGCSPTTIYTYLEILGINKENRTGTIQPGDKFNKLTVIKIIKRLKNRNIVWQCVCDCGKFRNVTTTLLKSNQAKSCGCHKGKGKTFRLWTGFGDISGHKWANSKNSAKNRNIEFNIDIKFCWDLFLQQNRKCALTGLPLSFEESTASIDRINNSEPYNETNIWWVHKDINKIKTSLSVEEFFYLCDLVTNYKQQYSKQLNNNHIYILSHYFKVIKANAIKRNIEFSITINDLQNLFTQQNEKCSITGLKLILPKTCTEFNNRIFTASLDRIDSNKNYTLDNIQWVHKIINRSKFNFNENYYKYLCSLVTHYNTKQARAFKFPIKFTRKNKSSNHKDPGQ